MRAYRHTLESLHDAILTQNADEASSHLRPHPRLSPQQQIAIYIDGYRIRLVTAIRADYPETLALLGEEYFDAMVKTYIESYPPVHYSLDVYPLAFADYLRAHSDDEFAADLARLESSIAQVFMETDSQPLLAGTFASLTPELLGHTKLYPRAASLRLRSSYPVERYLAACREGERPARPQAQHEHIYLVRHENEVKRHPLTEAEFLLLGELEAGVPIGDAFDMLADKYPQHMNETAQQLQNWFARWTLHGFFRMEAL